jgi:hypothetical protein
MGLAVEMAFSSQSAWQDEINGKATKTIDATLCPVPYGEAGKDFHFQNWRLTGVLSE